MVNQQRIIILEDDKSIRRLYRSLFIKAGFEVRAYCDARGVIDKTKKFMPDIVLTDLLMPKIDGYEALRLLKGTPETKSVPVVIISNLGDPVSQKKSAYLGASAFIVKANIQPAVLVDRVKDVLTGKAPKLHVDDNVIGFIKAEEYALSEHNKLTPEERQYA
ncbi:MAG: response regulator [bacterium]